MLKLNNDQIDLNKKKIIINILSNKYNPSDIYIFGRNYNAQILSSVISFNGFIDDFTKDKLWMGKKIYKTKDIENKNAIIISCSLAIYPVTALDSLKNKGFDNVITYLDFVKYSGLNLDIKFIKQANEDLQKNIYKYEKVYNLIKEKKSQDIFRDILNFRKNLNIQYMQNYKVDEKGQYFEDFLDFQENEVFIDAGGYDGTTSLQFIKHCPRYKSIYIFEPSTQNLILAKQKLSNYKNVYFFQQGLSNKKDILHFDADAGSASAISKKGTVTIEVDALDNIVKERVTFIKMDIEGAENLAISGMKEHIKRDYPKLAISVYHRPDDLWKIPEQIYAIRDDYDVYIRHYTEGTDETVMFFIPSKDN